MPTKSQNITDFKRIHAMSAAKSACVCLAVSGGDPSRKAPPRLSITSPQHTIGVVRMVKPLKPSKPGYFWSKFTEIPKETAVLRATKEWHLPFAHRGRTWAHQQAHGRS